MHVHLTQVQQRAHLCFQLLHEALVVHMPLDDVFDFAMDQVVPTSSSLIADDGKYCSTGMN